MSIAMLSSVSVSFYQLSGVLPVAASSTAPAPSVQRVDHDDDDQPRFRENTLVNAMMAAFRALGIGQTAVSPTNSATTTPATTTSAQTNTPAATATLAATPAANTVATTTDAVPPTDTLEKAVNEFAHALFGMLHRQGRNERSEGDHGGEHSHSHGGHHSRGYDGFVQRLENLAQSLGVAPAASASGTPAVSGTPPAIPATQSATVPATVTSPSASVPATDATSPTPNRGVTRLLAAFTKVMSFLQPQGTPATADTTGGMAEKLKLFLMTLAQSLHSGAGATSSSSVGSQVNVTV